MKGNSKAEFSINPRNLSSLTPPIGQLQKKKEDAATLRDTATLRDMILEEAKPPNLKSALPVTSSQEVGWYAAEHAEKDPFRGTLTRIRSLGLFRSRCDRPSLCSFLFTSLSLKSLRRLVTRSSMQRHTLKPSGLDLIRKLRLPRQLARAVQRRNNSVSSAAGLSRMTVADIVTDEYASHSFYHAC